MALKLKTKFKAENLTEVVYLHVYCPVDLEKEVTGKIQYVYNFKNGFRALTLDLLGR